MLFFFTYTFSWKYSCWCWCCYFFLTSVLSVGSINSPKVCSRNKYFQIYLPECRLLITFANSLQTFPRTWSGSKMFNTMMLFLKQLGFLKKNNKKTADNKNHNKFHSNEISFYIHVHCTSCSRKMVDITSELSDSHEISSSCCSHCRMNESNFLDYHHQKPPTQYYNVHVPSVSRRLTSFFWLNSDETKQFYHY